MNKTFLNSAITAAMAISIAACSGGDDVAGIGGSGVTSSGTITGFGSIFVNGVEFDTTSSTFSIDDSSGTESDLAIGMRVTVDGTLIDGVTGTATSVSYDDQLQGPISLLTENADLTIKTFSVLGTTVIVSSTDTSFDVSGSNPATYTYADLVNGNNVEISGFFNANGELEATRVELKDLTFDPATSIVELKGTITGLSGTSFSLTGIAGVTIDASTAAIEDLPGGLVDGAFVEVEGNCTDLACTTITATRVEGESEGFDDDGDFEVEGLITDFNGIDDFKVAGLPVNASGATLEPSTLVLDDDLKVEAEGDVINGVLFASEVKQRGGDNKVDGLVISVVNNQMEVEVDRGDNETVTVIVTTETEIEDDVGEQTPFNIGNIEPNVDFVEVRGFADASNDITATQVKVTDPENYTMQGVITAGDEVSGTVTVLGVTIPFDSNTDFEKADDTAFADAAEFFRAVIVGSTIIKVKDKLDAVGSNTPIGTADEIEIED